MYTYSNNDRHPVTKTFTPLNYTSPNYTSHFFTTLHYPLIWLNLLAPEFGI